MPNRIMYKICSLLTTYTIVYNLQLLKLCYRFNYFNNSYRIHSMQVTLDSCHCSDIIQMGHSMLITGLLNEWRGSLRGILIGNKLSQLLFVNTHKWNFWCCILVMNGFPKRSLALLAIRTQANCNITFLGCIRGKNHFSYEWNNWNLLLFNIILC